MRLRREPVPTLTIFEANSTPIVCEERMRPKSVSGLVGEGGRVRITFVFYEAVQDAGSVGFVRLRSLSWRGGGRGGERTFRSRLVRVV